MTERLVYVLSYTNALLPALPFASLAVEDGASALPHR